MLLGHDIYFNFGHPCISVCPAKLYCTASIATHSSNFLSILTIHCLCGVRVVMSWPWWTTLEYETVFFFLIFCLALGEKRLSSPQLMPMPCKYHQFFCVPSFVIAYNLQALFLCSLILSNSLHLSADTTASYSLCICLLYFNANAFRWHLHTSYSP